MNEIARIKSEVKPKQCVEMVRCRNESGLSISEWCRENGINLKTYYYRLKRVREALYSEKEQHDIVPVESIVESQGVEKKIERSVGEVKITLLDNFNSDMLSRLLEVLR